MLGTLLGMICDLIDSVCTQSDYLHYFYFLILGYTKITTFDNTSLCVLSSRSEFDARRVSFLIKVLMFSSIFNLKWKC